MRLSWKQSTAGRPEIQNDDNWSTYRSKRSTKVGCEQRQMWWQGGVLNQPMSKSYNPKTVSCLLQYNWFHQGGLICLKLWLVDLWANVSFLCDCVFISSTVNFIPSMRVFFVFLQSAKELGESLYICNMLISLIQHRCHTNYIANCMMDL